MREDCREVAEGEGFYVLVRGCYNVPVTRPAGGCYIINMLGQFMGERGEKGETRLGRV